MKTEINLRKKFGETHKYMVIKEILQINQWMKKELKWEIRKILGNEKNKETSCINSLDVTKAVVSVKFTARM